MAKNKAHIAHLLRQILCVDGHVVGVYTGQLFLPINETNVEFCVGREQALNAAEKVEHAVVKVTEEISIFNCLKNLMLNDSNDLIFAGIAVCGYSSS